VAGRQVDFLLVGGGIAAGSCARALRRAGAEGTILLVGREPDPPYDRPPLSKEYLRGDSTREAALLEGADWYAEHAIELLAKTSVMGLDVAARTAKLSSREEVSFGRALLATGANVRRLNVEGCELEGIHYLRTFGNSDAIREAAVDGARVVLIGGSYIGCEVAASLVQRGCRCTTVMMESLPLSRTFGAAAGRFFADTLAGHGIELRGDDELERFSGRDGRVTTVHTRRGPALDADLVVVGAGVVPDVSLARRAGLEIGESGGIKLDAGLRSSAEGIYAAGDIAEYVSVANPLPGGGGRRQRVEHWDVAFQQGRTAALNMLGREVAHEAVPYFFSDLADWVAIESVGPAYEWDREVVRGSFEEAAFTVFYLCDGIVQGAVTVGRSADLQAARRLIAGGTRLGSDADALGDLSTDLSTVGA
jgi:3-phenylpropionate/trans-cinnamate dioxygenase ferredoxin reductase subunit